MTNGPCRCESGIPAAVLEGFSCGNVDCWRTAAAQRSFEAFVAELKRARGEEAPIPPRPPVITSR